MFQTTGSAALFVKGRIEGVEILAVKIVLSNAYGVGDTVNMKYYRYHQVYIKSSLLPYVLYGFSIHSTAMVKPSIQFYDNLFHIKYTVFCEIIIISKTPALILKITKRYFLRKAE